MRTDKFSASLSTLIQKSELHERSESDSGIGTNNTLFLAAVASLNGDKIADSSSPAMAPVQQLALKSDEKHPQLHKQVVGTVGTHMHQDGDTVSRVMLDVTLVEKWYTTRGAVGKLGLIILCVAAPRWQL